MAALINLLRTSTFRLMAVYLVLFALSVGAVLGYVYWNTALLLERQGDETIRAEIAGLAEQYRQGGLQQLVAVLSARSGRPRNNVYLLTNFRGNKIVGNLNAGPIVISGDTGWTEFLYSARTGSGTAQHLARARYFTLAGGYRLVVGRDVNERRRFASLIRQALLWALAVTLLLGLGGGVFLSRTLLARIEAINKTSRAIMAGDLSERMVVRGTGDELDRLAGGLNDMLAQIERLMTGMREVTDNVAHDLKTPVTRLRARVEDALRGNSKTQYRQALEQTLVEADDLLNTFNAVLSIARAEAGEARAGMSDIDAGKLVSDLGELYEPLGEQPGARITLRVVDGLIVRADRQLLSQALANLIDNALKYGAAASGEEVEIELGAHRRDGAIVLSVADRGPGIAHHERARVLERFVRLDQARAKPGNGLGLSLVAGIAKLHGAQMVLSDNEPGLRVELIMPAHNPDLARKGQT